MGRKTEVEQGIFGWGGDQFFAGASLQLCGVSKRKGGGATWSHLPTLFLIEQSQDQYQDQDCYQRQQQDDNNTSVALDRRDPMTFVGGSGIRRH